MVLISKRRGGRYVVDSSIDANQLVSDANYNSQAHLFEELHAARLQRGKSVEEVARLLQTEPSVVEDIESGDYEPNLTELRQYAWAIEAVVDYRVHSCAVAPLALYRSQLMAVFNVEDSWLPGGEIPWSDDLDDSMSRSLVVRMVGEQGA